MNNRITALIADAGGNIFDVPEAEGVGRVGGKFFKLKPEELIKLPDSADLMFMPERQAIGFRRGEFVTLKGRAVSAILPQGYTRTHLPASKKAPNAQLLPLYGYTAVVLYKDELHAAAIYTDENHKWNPEHYNTSKLKNFIRRVKKELPNNRIVAQVKIYFIGVGSAESRLRRRVMQIVWAVFRCRRRSVVLVRKAESLLSRRSMRLLTLGFII